MSVPNSSLVLNVRRNEAELVRPARPTPNEVKPLADLDDLDVLRYQQSIIFAYAVSEGTMDGKDPAKVIKAALGEALVYYYPWAGRLREGPGGKLMVDCTAEGVVFVEADADARLQQFRVDDSLLPPFPCTEELIYNKASNTLAVVGCPMLTVQVTRLVCGGFILACSFIHVMTDGIGVLKFLSSVAELARGASAPSILPVWRRELLNTRDPPRPDDQDQDQDQLILQDQLTIPDDLVCRTFIFNPRDIAALRARVPQHLMSSYSSFDLISACLWRCRTIALGYRPEDKVSLGLVVNVWDKFNPPLPVGYYGNTWVYSVPVSPAGEVCNRPFGYTVELVKKAKEAVTGEYAKSYIDGGVLRGRRVPSNPNAYVISDVSNLPGSRLDFGLGKPAYFGPADNSWLPHLMSFIVAYRDGKGKAVAVWLPADAMDRFVNALGSLLMMDHCSKI